MRDRNAPHWKRIAVSASVVLICGMLINATVVTTWTATSRVSLNAALYILAIKGSLPGSGAGSELLAIVLYSAINGVLVGVPALLVLKGRKKLGVVLLSMYLFSIVPVFRDDMSHMFKSVLW